MRFIQQIHLEIENKKGVINKEADMMNRMSLIASVVLQHEIYIEHYRTDDNFKESYESLTHGTQIKENNYHIYDRLCLYILL